MKITALGSGSSGNCYLVDLGSSYLMLDCGVRVKELMSKIDINQIELIYLSHHHYDHDREYENKRFRAVPRIDGSINQGFNENRLYKQFKGLYSMYEFNIEHGGVPNSGLVFQNHKTCETLIYATDFTNCIWNLRKFKPNVVIIECNYCKEVVLSDDNFNRQVENIYRHLSLDGTIKFLKTLNLSKCEEIILVHVSSNYGNPEFMRETVEAEFGIKTGVALKNGGISYGGKENV